MIDLESININDIVREEIDRLLSESLGISDEVIMTTNDICNNIIYGIYDFIYPFGALGEYQIHCDRFNADNENTKSDAATDPKNKLINFNIAFYDGKPIKNSLYAVVSHEVEHIYQLEKKTSHGQVKSRYNVIYNQALKTFDATDSDYYDKELSRYFYVCSEMEQDAFVNELYQELSRTTRSNEVNVYKNSSAYKALMTIINVRREMTDVYGNGNYRAAIAKYGLNPKWVVNLGFHSEKRLKDKIRKVFVKAREERIENHISEHINLDSINI